MNDISNFVQVLKACESASGAGSKNIIKDELKKLTTGARELFKYAMDPFLVFGIKKFERLPKSQYSSTDNQYGLIIKVLNRLASGELTGNAARTAWGTALAEFTFETATYLERIIDKDLQAGFSPETYNKIWMSDPVRIFNVMLADKCSTEEEFESITFPCIADVKYDGERNIAIVKTTYEIIGTDGSKLVLAEDDEVKLVTGEVIKVKMLKVGDTLAA